MREAGRLELSVFRGVPELRVSSHQRPPRSQSVQSGCDGGNAGAATAWTKVTANRHLYGRRRTVNWLQR